MTDQSRPLRVAIVGAGPAGIYAADALMKSDTAKDRGVSIDLYERMPAPFGLIRYGVAPDHPRIKGIITALHRILGRGADQAAAIAQPIVERTKQIMGMIRSR